MDEVSTASSEPCTPADVDDLLSVVFIGPDRFDPNVRTVSVSVVAKLGPMVETRQPVMVCVKFGLDHCTDATLAMVCCLVYRVA